MPITRLVEETADDLLFDEDGNPRIKDFANAVQMWSFCQEKANVTVQEAALAFNTTPDIIRQAVERHYWMYLDGDSIEHEGE